MKNSNYEVVVESLGTVYCGESCMRASMAFYTFHNHAKSIKADVIFFENGKIKRRFVGSDADKCKTESQSVGVD